MGSETVINFCSPFVAITSFASCCVGFCLIFSFLFPPVFLSLGLLFAGLFGAYPSLLIRPLFSRIISISRIVVQGSYYSCAEAVRQHEKRDTLINRTCVSFFLWPQGFIFPDTRVLVEFLFSVFPGGFGGWHGCLFFPLLAQSRFLLQIKNPPGLLCNSYCHSLSISMVQLHLQSDILPSHPFQRFPICAVVGPGRRL